MFCLGYERVGRYCNRSLKLVKGCSLVVSKCWNRLYNLDEGGTGSDWTKMVVVRSEADQEESNYYGTLVHWRR